MDVSNKVLIIDDEENMRHMLTTILTRQGYAVEVAGDGREGVALLACREFDFVLCDIKMPVMDGMGFLRRVSSMEHVATIIMMSAYGSVDSALLAMQLGAYDYISKPFKAEEILLVLKKAEERERLRRENISLKKRLAGFESSLSLGTMVGKSGAMLDVFKLVDKIAPHLTTALITGESGTGKELVARGIHDKSRRAAQAFVAVNCGSIPVTLIESEFFGYVRGAFTGADRDKKGLFEEAEGGTLFLDEIGELPLDMQVKLLRVLQEHEIRRVGSAKSTKIDVRIVAATGKKLSEEVQGGRFREDLFYRLNVINVHIPPLRERPGDIPLLCDFFIDKFSGRFNMDHVQGVAPSAMTLLLKHSWPGNVRELENVIERAVVLAEKKVIMPENIPLEFGGRHPSRRLDDLYEGFSLQAARKIMESSLIGRALQVTGGNKSKASKLLKISYPTLLQKIKEYSL